MPGAEPCRGGRHGSRRDEPEGRRDKGGAHGNGSAGNGGVGEPGGAASFFDCGTPGRIRNADRLAQHGFPAASDGHVAGGSALDALPLPRKGRGRTGHAVPKRDHGGVAFAHGLGSLVELLLQVPIGLLQSGGALRQLAAPAERRRSGGDHRVHRRQSRFGGACRRAGRREHLDGIAVRRTERQEPRVRRAGGFPQRFEPNRGGHLAAVRVGKDRALFLRDQGLAQRGGDLRRACTVGCPRLDLDQAVTGMRHQRRGECFGEPGDGTRGAQETGGDAKLLGKRRGRRGHGRPVQGRRGSDDDRLRYSEVGRRSRGGEPERRGRLVDGDDGARLKEGRGQCHTCNGGRCHGNRGRDRNLATHRSR